MLVGAFVRVVSHAVRTSASITLLKNRRFISHYAAPMSSTTIDARIGAPEKIAVFVVV